MVVNCNSTYTLSCCIKTFIIKPNKAMEIVLLYYFYKTTEIEGAASGADLYFTKPINTNLPELTIKKHF